MAIKHTYIASRDGYARFYSREPSADCFTTKELTPIRAIRAYCLECSNYSAYEVTNCTIPTCPLYPFRYGKTGNKREVSEEQIERLADMRQKLKKNRSASLVE